MKRTQLVLGSFHISSSKCCCLVISANVQHGTWLGPKPAAACGTGAERALWDRSPPPPVADEGGRSVGNRKELPGARLCEFPGSKQRGEASGTARSAIGVTMQFPGAMKAGGASGT